MKGHGEYTLASTSWPASVWNPGHDRLVDELNVVDGAEGGGAHGEFMIRWVPLGHSNGPSTRVDAFSDGWALAHEVLGWLLVYADEDPTPAEVIAVLEEHGFKPSEFHGRLQGNRWGHKV